MRSDGVDEKGADPEPAAAAPTGAEKVVAVIAVCAFFVWLPVWTFLLRVPFDDWAAEYIESYPAVLPVVGPPFLLGFIGWAISSRRPRQLLGVMCLTLCGFFLYFAPQMSVRQEQEKAIGLSPTWTHVAFVGSVATYLMDEGMVYRVAFAPASPLPSRRASAARIESQIEVPVGEGFALDSLRRSSDKIYEAPDGTLLRAQYVDFLKGTRPTVHLHPRKRGNVVIVSYRGVPVGILMPDGIDARAWAEAEF